MQGLWCQCGVLIEKYKYLNICSLVMREAEIFEKLIDILKDLNHPSYNILNQKKQSFLDTIEKLNEIERKAFLFAIVLFINKEHRELLLKILTLEEKDREAIKNVVGAINDYKQN